jgi:hypothetical protein
MAFSPNREPIHIVLIAPQMICWGLQQLVLPARTAARCVALTASQDQATLDLAALAADTGSPGKVIASRLCISEHTLRNHPSSIYRKLMLSSRLDLYAFAARHKLDRIAQKRPTPAATRSRSQPQFTSRTRPLASSHKVRRPTMYSLVTIWSCRTMRAVVAPA